MVHRLSHLSHGIILQGTCTLALAARELVNREAGGDPGRLKTLSCRFSGMVRPGTTISLELKFRNKEDLFFEVTTEVGQAAILSYLDSKSDHVQT